MSDYIWDTDHISLYQRDHPDIVRRAQAVSFARIVITTISVEEQLRGRLAQVSAARSEQKRVQALYWLRETLEDLCDYQVIDFDDVAAARFESLRRQLRRVGSQDLRIAAVALTTDRILVTRNSRDFGQVPGLVIEDWTQP